jgi:hypothetical protein
MVGTALDGWYSLERFNTARTAPDGWYSSRWLVQFRQLQMAYSNGFNFVICIVYRSGRGLLVNVYTRGRGFLKPFTVNDYNDLKPFTLLALEPM